MTNQNTTGILDTLEPEVVDRIDAAKRELFFGSPAKMAKMAAFASAPLALAIGANAAFGAELPAQIKDVLQFALTLEHIEDFFYRAGGSTEGLIPEQYRKIFLAIGLHEAEHVALLTSVIGPDAVKRPKIDATAGGKYADVLTNFDTYLTLSQTFENLGVAAYKGQAANLISNDDLLQAALQIHSVEARHAAIVMKIGGKKSWTGAFDEPLSKEKVLAAAKPFLA